MLLLIGVLTLARFVTAAYLPLSFDEAYFWLWSKNLAISYYDHPPLIALAIRLGTLVFGDTEFGVRAVSLAASVAASWAVWRAGAVLLGNEAAGVTASVLFNLTLMVATQSMSATPDALVLAEAAFVLLSVAKLQASGDGRWWIAVGASLGMALLTKYTAFFLGAGVALWLVVAGRHWLKSPWPYAAAMLAFAFFVPNLLWNAAHDWVSFKFQFGRVVEGAPALKYFFEFIAGQIALASPFILLAAIFGLAASHRGGKRTLWIAATLVWPALGYFAIHAIHSRVQGNWPSFTYPPLAVLAASAFHRDQLRANRLLTLSRRLAVPVALTILIVTYAQAVMGFLPWGIHDPVARMTAQGIGPVVSEISTLARQRKAAAIVTADYVPTGWISFYLRPSMPVLPVAEDYRYLQAPRADARILQKPLVFVTRNPALELPDVAKHFSQIRLEKILPRMRSGAIIDRFFVYSLSGFHGAPVGRLPFLTGD